MTQAEDIAQILKIMKFFLREHQRKHRGAEFKDKDVTDVTK